MHLAAFTAKDKHAAWLMGHFISEQRRRKTCSLYLPASCRTRLKKTQASRGSLTRNAHWSPPFLWVPLTHPLKVERTLRILPILTVSGQRRTGKSISCRDAALHSGINRHDTRAHEICHIKNPRCVILFWPFLHSWHDPADFAKWQTLHWRRSVSEWSDVDAQEIRAYGTSHPGRCVPVQRGIYPQSVGWPEWETSLQGHHVPQMISNDKRQPPIRWPTCCCHGGEVTDHYCCPHTAIATAATSSTRRRGECWLCTSLK